MAEGYSGDASDRYHFDAPSQVVDLKELENVQTDDLWFEQRALGAGVNLETPLKSDRPSVRGNLRVNTDMDTDSGMAQPPNVVTSWGSKSAADQAGARPKSSTAYQPPAQPRRVPKRKGQGSVPASPASKKYKNPAVQPALKRRSLRRRSGRLNSRATERTRAEASTTGNAEPTSSEVQELERIRNLQKEVALHRRENEASYKAALAGNPPQPKKMVLSSTIPKEFHFRTDARVKASTSSNTAQNEEDFISQLRKPSSPAKAMKSATVPQPFNLSMGNKRKMEESSVYVPMAQQIHEFQKRTPARYHLRSRKSQDRGPSAVKGDHLKLTQPHTPHLMTHQRSRPPTVKSSADLEAEEVDRLQKFKFKASELNRKMLKGAEVPKKPAVKEPTVPEGFELQIEKRLQERQTTKPQGGEEKLHTFKSQPLPKNMLEGVVGVPEKKVLPPTVPQSPAFALKKRIHKEPRIDEVKQPSPIKAPRVPHFGLPFQPRLPENHLVEVCPFSFEEREREKRALKEKRLEKQNEEVPQFKAQPLPDFDAVVLPEKRKLEPTKLEPFRLLTDERGAASSGRWEQMVKEEQKQREEGVEFKARPNTVTHKEPFLPKKESRPAVVPEAFELSTQQRARVRQEFEQLVSEKEALRKLMEEERRREVEQREKEEIARLRQEQVHKAQPIRHYKPLELKKSELPPTVPQSPNFSDRFRL